MPLAPLGNTEWSIGGQIAFNAINKRLGIFAPQVPLIKMGSKRKICAAATKRDNLTSIFKMDAGHFRWDDGTLYTE
jgi:hypothetical protein